MVPILERPPSRDCSFSLAERSMGADTMSRNWVFLGDSLTEGVGSQRISHVSELVTYLRANTTKTGGVRAIHHMRLRSVDPAGFDPLIKFNIAGFIDTDERQDPALWIWNLACEGRTIEADFDWLPFVRNLNPEFVIIFRGSLESIIRPAMVRDNSWPWWVPRSWRAYPRLDPRCYYSSTWWRKAKQSSIDKVKQATRRKLLQLRPGQPLMNLESLSNYYTELLNQFRYLGTRTIVLGLLPVDDCSFPGSSAQFRAVNQKLKEISTALNVEFLDWGNLLSAIDAEQDLFYRDGFHPNVKGARALAEILRGHLGKVVA